MIERVNATRAKLAAIVAAVDLPGLAAVLPAVPVATAADTLIDPEIPDRLQAAARAFVDGNDGSGLGALDALIPGEYIGQAYEP